MLDQFAELWIRKMYGCKKWHVIIFASKFFVIQFLLFVAWLIIQIISISLVLNDGSNNSNKSSNLNETNQSPSAFVVCKILPFHLNHHLWFLSLHQTLPPKPVTVALTMDQIVCHLCLWWQQNTWGMWRLIPLYLLKSKVSREMQRNLRTPFMHLY